MSLESLLGNTMQVVDGRDGKIGLSLGRVCTLPNGYGTSSISPKIENPNEKGREFGREFGILMYKSPTKIVYFPESALAQLNKISFAILYGGSYTHDAEKDDPVSDIIYKDFVRYLSNVGIRKPK